MSKSVNQQIVISGIGGQGVLFVTRLLAEAAISQSLRVFTSETHGMAQRGGSVISHLKVGNFFSPMIRPFTADGMLALKAENIVQHGSYLKPDSWLVVNSANGKKPELDVPQDTFAADADRLAQEINNPKSVNLVMLGYALAQLSVSALGQSKLFCSQRDIQAVLKIRLVGKEAMLNASLKALEVGYKAH